MEYTLTTNFHIWAQGPPRAPGPDSPPHNVLRLGSYQMGCMRPWSIRSTRTFTSGARGPQGPRGPTLPPLTMCYDWVSEIPTPIYRNSRGSSERISNDTPAKLPQLMRTDFTNKRTTLNRFAVKSVLISRGSLSRLPFGIRRHGPQESPPHNVLRLGSCQMGCMRSWNIRSPRTFTSGARGPPGPRAPTLPPHNVLRLGTCQLGCMRSWNIRSP